MDALVELLKILVPAALVLYAMYLVVKSFLDKEFQRQVVGIRDKNTEIVLPIRLQAYERMVLFLERITPGNLLRRINTTELSARELQFVLINEVREEFSHNLAQQLYMSDNSWSAIKQAMEEVIAIINQSADGLPENAGGNELRRQIFQKVVDENADPTGRALTRVKDEIRQIF